MRNIKRNLLVVITICMAGFCWSQSTAVNKEQLFAADHPYIQYVGRIDFSNPQLPRIWMPGVYIQAKFTGRYCKVLLNDEMLYGSFHNYMEIAIDGKLQRMALSGKTNEIEVANNLPNGEHTITICKNTEAGIGYIEFAGLKCESLKPVPAKPSRKIEFIGNSITCGASSDESVIPCGKGVWHDQHNAYLAYGPTTARALNAQYHLSSVSGIGLIHSCCNLPVLMPQVFDKVNMRNDSIAWNFSKYTPDVVTVCLGQNDGIQDSTAFVSNYISFVKRLRSYYPKAVIICLTSPMADENLKRFMTKSLSAVTNTLNRSGDKKIYMYVFKKRYYKGCDTHPNIEEHQQIAKELMPFIKKKMKWKEIK